MSESGCGCERASAAARSTTEILHMMVSCHRSNGLLGETARDVIPAETKPWSLLIDHKVAAKYNTNAELYHRYFSMVKPGTSRKKADSHSKKHQTLILQKACWTGVYHRKTYNKMLECRILFAAIHIPLFFCLHCGIIMEGIIILNISSSWLQFQETECLNLLSVTPPLGSHAFNNLRCSHAGTAACKTVSVFSLCY